MTITAASPADLANSLGAKATGEWLRIDQDRVDAFVEKTRILRKPII